MREKIENILKEYKAYKTGGLTHATNELLDLIRDNQRSELLAFKQFISKTPLIELEFYSDEEFIDLYIKNNIHE